MKLGTAFLRGVVVTVAVVVTLFVMSVVGLGIVQATSHRVPSPKPVRALPECVWDATGQATNAPCRQLTKYIAYTPVPSMP